MMHTYALYGTDKFRCIAAACTDSCCVGWDVVIDDDSAARYRAMGTPLGRRIADCMVTDEDGDTVFTCVDGKCPFLRDDRLCEIQCQCGESALSVTCARFPRIVQEYDDFTEYCLSLSCPEAARIVLTAPRLTAPEPQTEDPYLQMLIRIRTRMIALVQDRSRSFGEDLRRCLLYAQKMQAQLWDGTVDPACAVGTLPEAGTADVDALFAFHAQLELMTAEFPHLAKTARSSPSENRTLLENLAVYSLYRYVLQAVEDGDLLSKVLQMLTAVTFVAFADGEAQDVARLYAKEVEHSYENMDALVEAFYTHDAFSVQNFYAIWDR